jgi:hypothetical protein
MSSRLSLSGLGITAVGWPYKGVIRHGRKASLARPNDARHWLVLCPTRASTPSRRASTRNQGFPLPGPFYAPFNMYWRTR